MYEYLKSLNSTHAAIAAGYSKKTAGSQGHRLLKNVYVSKKIQAAMDARAKRTEVTIDRVIAELARIAFADPRNVMKWGPNGVTLEDSESLTDDQAACVAEVSETIGRDGGSLKVKFHSKVDALKELRDHLRVSSSPPPTNVITGDVIIVDGRAGTDSRVDGPTDPQREPEPGPTEGAAKP